MNCLRLLRTISLSLADSIGKCLIATPVPDAYNSGSIELRSNSLLRHSASDDAGVPTAIIRYV
jgi:hypothetical protein